MQALERRLLIAESTLEVSPEEDAQMADIREADDAAVLSQGGSGMGAVRMPDSTAVQIGARRSAAMQSGDVSNAAAAAAGRPSDGKAAPTAAGALPADPGDQALASGQSEGGVRMEKRSVSFAEAPLTQAAEATAQPKGQGLKKGFLSRHPKSVLKKASPQLDDSSPAHKSSRNTGSTPPAVNSRGQAQADTCQGRDTAFSGVIVDRSSGIPAHHHSPRPGAAGWDSDQRNTVDGIKKVSRFKQQRQGQGQSHAVCFT